MNAAEFSNRMEAQKARVDAAKDDYDRAVQEASNAERVYRKERHKAYVRCPQGTVDYRKSWVDAETADLRYVRDLSANYLRGALETYRARIQEMSALQSESKAYREEAAFARTGPEFAA